MLNEIFKCLKALKKVTKQLKRDENDPQLNLSLKLKMKLGAEINLKLQSFFLSEYSGKKNTKEADISKNVYHDINFKAHFLPLINSA